MSCSFSFKKEAKVYAVSKGKRYTLDFSTLDFGQTFTEHSYSNKTVQIPNMFEQSVINKANPANFELTFPAIRESDLLILFNRALDYNTFDLYVVVGPDVYLIETCVITSTNFIIEKTRPLSISIQGEAIKVSVPGSSDDFIVPGTSVARSPNRTYNKADYINIRLDNIAYEGINSVNISLDTEVTWTPYTTVNDALYALDRDSSMYPKDFSVKKRNLSGDFIAYYTDEPKWAINIPIYIEAGDRVGSTIYGLKFDIKKTAFTSTLLTGNVFTYQHNWRMTENPDSLTEVIKYIGYTDTALAIKDHLGFDILDYLGNPITEST
jgi:hypothetical protein